MTTKICHLNGWLKNSHSNAVSATTRWSRFFALQNTPRQAIELEGLQVRPLDLGVQNVRFDMELHLWEEGERLGGGCVYNVDLFDAVTIERMMGHYQTLLAGIVANPSCSILKLPLLTTAERHQILMAWNDTVTDYPKDQCIHQLFEEQVERTPHAVAVVFEGERLTYLELNQRANQLAHYLIQQGVGPDVLVGICVERSLEMVVGLLGILKAGGAYVPLDPTYPQERIAYMLEDTAASVLLTQEKLYTILPERPTKLCLDTLDLRADQSTLSSIASVSAENLAYIMYTSGSTGRPKGVSVMHRNVVRLVKNTDFIQLSQDDLFLQFAPISFDAATLEIWGPLLNGGQLVVMPPANPSLHELGEAIQEHRITTLWLTSGLFHQMVDEQLDALQSLRWLLAGGDVLSVSRR
ncbi:AMP-binding protein [Chloroflexi bacterium TSY]|nr:AMP-binding protein [Chloroflexi bacterium TSY]